VNTLFIPVSALAGDNVVHSSKAMSWYSGPFAAEALESLPAVRGAQGLPLRSGAAVVRPDLRFVIRRQIASGKVSVGDPIVVLPSGTRRL